MLVIHATAGSARSALAWLTTPLSRVSAHYLIDKSGRVYQLVPDERAAWHAGRARWHGETAINDSSIGVELENANDGRDAYPAAQIDALLELAAEKTAQYRIAPDMVVRHADIAVPKGRKTDPAGFPWADFIGRLFPRGARPPADRAPYPIPALPDASQLARALREAAYRQVGAIDRPDWAMLRLAQSEQLGFPIGPAFDFALAGRSFIGQSFGKETLFSPTGDWAKVERLGQLRDEAQRPLRETVLQAVYAQAGAAYQPDSPLQSYAWRAALGPPLGSSFRLASAGVEYEAASYALDTIYCPAGNPQQIERLSSIAARMNVSEPPPPAQALIEQLFQRVGSQFRADWAMHQYALREGCAAPLGRSFRISSNGRDYLAEAFALDVVYCVVGDWKTLARLSALNV
jgi:hypothetical protein